MQTRINALIKLLKLLRDYLVNFINNNPNRRTMTIGELKSIIHQDVYDNSDIVDLLSSSISNDKEDENSNSSLGNSRRLSSSHFNTGSSDKAA